MTTRGENTGQRFAGDRYERLRRAGHTAAEDPAVADAPHPFDSTGLMTLIERITDRRLLDALLETDADWASLMVLIDFPHGPDAVALRAHRLTDDAPDGLADMPTVARVLLDTAAVMIDVLVAAANGDRSRR